MIVDQEEYEAAVSCMVEAAESARVHRDELLGRLGRVFARREPRLQAGTYVDGLMSDIPCKNGWSLAERAGDRTPDKMGAVVQPLGVGRTRRDGHRG